jgi:uncharacterized protein
MQRLRTGATNFIDQQLIPADTPAPLGCPYFFMDQDWIDSFREKLDQHYRWPSLYMFKFIVPKGKEEEVKKLFPMHTTNERSSREGNYISITIQIMAPSSDTVIDLYQKAATIEGLIAL